MKTKVSRYPSPNHFHRRVVIEYIGDDGKEDINKRVFLDVSYHNVKGDDKRVVYKAWAYDNGQFERWYRNVFPNQRAHAEAASPLTFLYHLGINHPEAESIVKEWESEGWEPTGVSQYNFNTHAADFLTPLPDRNVFKHKTATEEFVDSLTPEEVTDLIERLMAIKRKRAAEDFRMYWPLAMDALKGAGKRELAEQLQLTVNNSVGA